MLVETPLTGKTKHTVNVARIKPPPRTAHISLKERNWNHIF